MLAAGLRAMLCLVAALSLIAGCGPDRLKPSAAGSGKRAWTLDHVGGGPLLAKLRRRAAALGLDARIRWRGAFWARPIAWAR